MPESRSKLRTPKTPAGLDLDLSPPARLDLWALTLALGIVLGTLAPPLGVAFVLASAVVCVGVIYWRDLVPKDWRFMAMLAPLFAAGGVGIASLHLATPDPLAELAEIQPGEVTVVGEIVSPPVRGALVTGRTFGSSIFGTTRKKCCGAAACKYSREILASGSGIGFGWMAR